MLDGKWVRLDVPREAELPPDGVTWIDGSGCRVSFVVAWIPLPAPPEVTK